MRKKMGFFVIAMITMCRNIAADSTVTMGSKITLFSALLSEARTCYIHLPSGYSTESNSKKNYPVIYLLDGDMHFNAVSSMVESFATGINGTFLMPDMIVVGIVNTNRIRDLTPTHSDLNPNSTLNERFKVSGGGDTFLKFITTELIPFIENKYRTDKQRILIGHSLGGIMVLDALIKNTKLFTSYIVIDPSVWWDERTMLSKTTQFLDSADLKNKSLFLAQANFADTTGNHFQAIKELKKAIDKSSATGLRSRYRFYPDDSHGSVPFIAEYDGLRFIFSGYKKQ